MSQMTDREFWILVHRGLLTVVTAIEKRWGFRRDSLSTLTPLGGGPTQAVNNNHEPLATPLARSTSPQERIG